MALSGISEGQLQVLDTRIKHVQVCVAGIQDDRTPAGQLLQHCEGTQAGAAIALRGSTVRRDSHIDHSSGCGVHQSRSYFDSLRKALRLQVQV